MKYTIITATLLAATLAWAGCGKDDAGAASGAVAEGERSLPGDPEAGATVYKRACVACHAADGRANGGVTGADFIGDPSRLAKPNDVLLTSIRDGVDGNPPMPPQGQLLSEQEMKDVLAYLREEFGSGG
jgi:mono/diheme cytochrome c family protein